MGRKNFSKETKAKAIGMVHGGKPINEVAKKFSTTQNSIRAWIKAAEETGFLRPGTRVTKSSDYLDPVKNLPTLNELHNEIAELKEENAVLLRIISRRK